MEKEMPRSLNSHIIGKEQKDVDLMFNSIAPKYDRLNRILSLRFDVRWRKKLVKLIRNEKSNSILDLAAGTGDLSLQLLKLNPATIYAADPSSGMLDIARKKFDKKHANIDIFQCSAEKLPFDNLSFNIVSIAFGIRNFANHSLALSEIHRVLKNDGILAVLEFGLPRKNLFGRFFLWYFKNILPLLGRLISKHYSAYSYLPQTVQKFPYGSDFQKFMHENHFTVFHTHKLSSGIAYIYLINKNT